MNKFLKLVIAVAAVWLLWWLFIAEGAEVSGEAGVGVSSDYVWRGLKVEGGPVVQPDVSVSLGAVTVGWWGNVSTTHDVAYDPVEFTEHDLSLELALPVDLPAGGALAVGVLDYLLVNQDAQDTVEVYASLGFDDLWLTPELGVWRDVDAVSGWYARASVGHGFELVPWATLGGRLFAGAGDARWVGAYYSADSGVVDVGGSLEVTAVAGAWSFTPSLAYSWVPRDELDTGGVLVGGVEARRAW